MHQALQNYLSLETKSIVQGCPSASVFLVKAMECKKIMLQAREFSVVDKIRVCILKKKEWNVKNEEHQEQDIDVFCCSELTSVLAKILKCIFEFQQPAR